MKAAAPLNQIAETDATFRREGKAWTGRCLICSGPLRFDAETGEGASVEHIVPRSPGGGNDLENLGIAHRRCNGEKGIHWDGGRRRPAQPERYSELVGRLLRTRRARWRDPAAPEVWVP